MRVLLIHNATQVLAGELIRTPARIEIMGQIYNRVDDPETGEFLGAYALVGSETYTVENWAACKVDQHPQTPTSEDWVMGGEPDPFTYKGPLTPEGRVPGGPPRPITDTGPLTLEENSGRSTDMLSSVYMEWRVKIDQRFKDMLETAYDAGYARAHYTHTGEKSHGDDLPLTFEEWLAKMLEENSGD